MKWNKKLFTASVLCLTVSGGQAFASGYATGLTSTSGLATSYAGSATGMHDASDMFFNPAILANTKDSEFIFSVSYKSFDVNPQGATTASGSATGSEVRDAGVDTTLPALYVAKRINENAVFGLAVTSPFGIQNKYDPNWQGKERSVETSVTTLNINPSLAYKLTDKLSLGAGLEAQYITATFTGMTSIGGGNHAANKMHGSDWGYGYTLGAKYQATDRLKFGLGYRSKIDHNLAGNIRIIGRSSSNVEAQLSTPESVTGGAAYKFNPTIELAYDVTWTRWSRINQMSMVAYQNSTINSALQKPRALVYKDSVMHAVGANFALNDKWLLRSGVAYEKETTIGTRMPSANNIWASLGFNYKLSKTFSIDASYMHQFYQNSAIRFKDSSATSDNSLNLHYKIRSDVFSLALKKEF